MLNVRVRMVTAICRPGRAVTFALSVFTGTRAPIGQPPASQSLATREGTEFEKLRTAVRCSVPAARCSVVLRPHLSPLNTRPIYRVAPTTSPPTALHGRERNVVYLREKASGTSECGSFFFKDAEVLGPDSCELHGSSLVFLTDSRWHLIDAI